MKLFDLAYSIATENHGILTAAEARANGIASKDLARWVRIGRFVKYGNGVYKATQYPYSEDDPYAVAVAQCGKGAYLCGESVIGLLRLMPVSIDRIHVRTPHRLRHSHMGERLLQAAQTAYTAGHIGKNEFEKLKEAIGHA